MTPAEKICKLTDTLKSDRSAWETSWQVLANHLWPTHDRFVSEGATPGTNNQGVYITDSYPVHSRNLLASGLQSLLVNSATNWFYLKTNNLTLEKKVQIQELLQTNNKRMLSMFGNSNFYTQSYQFWLYFIVFGNAVMFIEKDKQKVVRFQVIHLNETLFRTSYTGEVNSLFRLYSISVDQLIEQFGIENVSDAVRKKASKKGTETVECIHAVFPKSETGIGSEWKTSNPYLTELEYVSVYIEKKSNHVLNQEGFEDFPYVVARLNVAYGQDYGHGIAWDILPDIKTLYKMNTTTMKGAQKTVEPAYMIPDQLMSRGVFSPGANKINIIRPNAGEIKPVFIPPGIPITMELMEQKRQLIGSMFLNDQLQLVHQKVMTATEALQEAEQKMRLLSPLLTQGQSEGLKRIIERTYGIMTRSGQLEEFPEEAISAGLEIEYMSPLARAQRYHELTAMQELMVFVMPLIEINPQITSLVNMDELIRTTGEILGVPAGVLNSQAKVDEINRARMERQKIEESAQAFQFAAEQDKTISETKMNEERSNEAAR